MDDADPVCRPPGALLKYAAMSKLLPGENLVVKDHPHWITLARTLWVPVLAVIVVVWADFTVLLDNYDILPGAHFRTFLTLAVVAAALLWFIVVWIRWRSISYTLTDQRITIEAGVFSRQEKIIPIDRVQDCTTRQSIFGRLIGYGRVEIDAAGAQGAELLDHLPKPGEFRDQVFVQSEKRRGAAVVAPTPVPANPSGV
jgi:uncharacterized membrane protein YdbT with pleckstrin-like domain